jgi:hypothetical protein
MTTQIYVFLLEGSTTNPWESENGGHFGAFQGRVEAMVDRISGC